MWLLVRTTHGPRGHHPRSAGLSMRDDFTPRRPGQRHAGAGVPLVEDYVTGHGAGSAATPIFLRSVTVYPDNPAGRLHQLLTAFRRSSSQYPSAAAWAGPVGLPDSTNASELARRISLVLQ